MNQVILKPGRERSLLRKHPWVFSGAIKNLKGQSKNGETVEVLSSEGQFLGLAAYSAHSQIRLRLWSFSNEPIDEGFFHKRIQNALALRDDLGISKQSSAYRLIASEADDLPGLTVDRYADTLVCQFLASGVEFWKASIVKSLQTLTGVKSIFERSDSNLRKKEGLEPISQLLWGQEPPDLLEIREQGLRFFVDVKKGHKTGFYLDQRKNRQLVLKHSQNAEVLNCFAYTGGFGLAALAGGAKYVTNLEDVASLVSLTEKNCQLNQFSPERYNNLKADVFKELRNYQSDGRRFDLIILDPPKFAESQGHLNKASRGYKDINRLALELLKPGGLLFSFSCSGLMKQELFQKIVTDAALDAERKVQILEFLSQSPDHRIDLAIPESFYLKGFLLKAC